MAKILVVDDIKEIVDFSREFFEDFGYEVRTAETAPDAIAAQQEFHADVILQDLNIPGGGGVLVYETLRARLDMVPIIFSTGKPETIGNVAAMRNVSVLRKPTHPEALMAEVQKWLAARPQQAPAAPQPAAPQPAAPPPPAGERPMNPVPPPPPPPRFPRQ